ncbi:cryptochrome/photolyase family protein [filamentous cyanobacterium LEGE 11480]|uniref:Cryptochrome/photolyase family protein n=1 Tax=Romeriopsis navalis LEGE 11480 TaxID=2777977 RepID=A0A928VJ88_9CYAN|nr:cryptochrome/photolyase family protein [Romeriopsis navalis]MBE9029638.1 cryptochrome/photolyase family protein [Romeriopsis navalis LEGE 11480]
MTIGVWVLGDQLWENQAALASVGTDTPVILIESLHHIQVRPYHQQKLIFLWSAMRHFAQDLERAGYAVTYDEAADFQTPLKAWIQAYNITELRIMQPTDRPFARLISGLRLDCKIVLFDNNQFIWTAAEFLDWAQPRKRMRMEDFYRESRKRLDILLEDGQPIGGQWNLDPENRKPPKKKNADFQPPRRQDFVPDAMTQAVIKKVRALDIATYGKAEPFQWGVTCAEAEEALNAFIETRLDTFGPYQDAMVTGEDTMWHSLISPYLNVGLLQPLAVVQAVEQTYHDRDLPLNSVEGFIRQVIGWREYMRGVYVMTDDDYAEQNWFGHQQPLPDFFWNAKNAKMNCLKQCLDQTERTAYAHHIQRLMILSNFALIAGINPQAIENWFHAAYIDAYDWVMQTNVLGMGQFADGGLLASKPYVSSANYVNKMSDYCKGCEYNHKARIGDDACPFNFFYWNFLDRHRAKLKSQGRMSFILKNLDKIDREELATIRQQAQDWHQSSIA